MTASIGRRVLIIVENLPVPFDRRVWSEATTLVKAGYAVSVICPKGKGATSSYEVIDGVHIYRHPLPLEAEGALGYALEYGAALFWEFLLSLKVARQRGFDVVHACNPPDTIFLIGGFYRLFGKKFLFDHHDINPELYEAKFNRRDFGWKLMVWLERLSFRTANISIATNESYRDIAITRGGMAPDKVHIVRSGPNLDRVREVAPDPKWRNGRRFVVGYVGVIGKQEGLDLLLDSVEHLVKVRKRDDIQFVICGGGSELEAIKAETVARSLGDYVTYTGRCSDETLFSALSTSDICVNPDRPTAMNDKSTMNKIMEYMALGKPIVQYDLREGRFSARDSSLYAKCTEPADFGDKIVELLDDPERRAAMGAIGRERVRTELAWSHEAPKLLAAYGSLFAPEIHDASVRRDAGVSEESATRGQG
ncbi:MULTISPECIES: glycosyltransferase family 4 protein [unclassified Mesorhizobium]|uniref:glycosyltransferase family 4 protein n=1 Tax=unclassified Mesorhizobium TaxID=325217 RepID=UPI001ACB368A|nr:MULTISPECIES: glycosyltransferase family 4 protein [unclassified Mesorhizobium]MBN9255005.1 glycosyltransferase family 4 protein [Mesorhizobium sp.]